MAKRKPNPTGFGSDYYSDRELLVDVLNKGLTEAGLPYRVASRKQIERIYAGHWQRAAGAARWHAFADRTDGATSVLDVISFDTMRECVRYGVQLEPMPVTNDWQALAKTPANGLAA